MLRRVLAVLSVVLVAGCGGDSTSPNADVSGLWTYNATNVVGGGITCSITNVSMTLTQSGTTFSGTVAAGGTLTCSSPSGSDTESLGNDVIANGLINGNGIQFDIGTQDLHNTGTLSGNSMSGTVTIRVATGTATIILTGNFTAVRQ